MGRTKGTVTATGSVLALAVLTLGAAAFSVSHSPRPAVRSASALLTSHQSWIPVAFGSIQLSVPPSWTVVDGGGSRCRVSPGVILSDWDATPPSQWCPAGSGPSSPSTTIITLSRTTRLPQVPRRSSVVHGITLLENIDSVTPQTRNDPTGIPNGGGAYLLRPEDIEIAVSGPPAASVLQTLRISPRASVTAPGSGPHVPETWRRVSFDGVHFAVPPSWPVLRLRDPPFCDSPVALDSQSRPSAIVTTEALPPSTASCVDRNPLPPMNGIELDAAKAVYPTGTCIPRRQRGLVLCLDQSSPWSILFARITEPSGRTLNVQLGLAGDGRVARTVLHSLSG
jgi:hypothetical protein